MSKKEKFDELANNIIDYVGGKENIVFFNHCITRLRINVKDKSRVKVKEIESISGVIGCQWQGDQLQIIIGQAVAEAYRLICEKTGLTEQTSIDENLERSKNNRLNAILDTISGCFAPLIPAFAGAGLLKGLLILLTTYAVVDKTTGIYLIINAAADATFYFLPFLLAVTSAKKFKTSEMLAVVIAGIYMYPTILGAAGTTINVLGMDVMLVKYSSTALPIILSVWVMSYIYRWINKFIPGYLRVVLVSAILLLVMAPLSIVVIGPLGFNIGTYIGRFFEWLFTVSPFLGGLIVGATRPLMIFTGTHVTLAPIMINNIEVLGYDMLSPVHAVATMAAAGMSFGAFLKAKNAENKAANFSAFVSGFIGITEPAIYGVAFRYKKPLIALCIGGGVAGAFVAVMGAKAIAFGMPSIISLPIYAGSIPTLLVGLAIAFVLTAGLTYAFGFDEDIQKDHKAIDAEKKNII